MIESLPRNDAVLRRRQILDAADEVFGEHGVNAPLELVVERAGLGRATLYRAFPDRTALMAALLERGMEAFERAAGDMDGKPGDLGVLLHDVADYIAESAPMMDYWRSMDRDHPVLLDVDRRALAIFMPLVRRAQAAGLCDPTVDEEQVLLANGMLAGCLHGNDQAERRRLAHRAADLVLRALGMPVAGGHPGR